MADSDLTDAIPPGTPTLAELKASVPPRDCPVCPHRIRDHEATGCRARPGGKACACAVPGSELELAARRAGRDLAPDELAGDLVIDDVDDNPPHQVATPGDTLDTPGDTPEQTPESGRDSAEKADTELAEPLEGGETGDRGELLDDNGAPGGSEQPGEPGEMPGEPGNPADPAATQPTVVDYKGRPIELKPPPAGKRNRIYDWPAIKRRYVEGHPATDGSGVTEWPSLDAVAEHFGLPPQRIREKSAIEGWVGARQKWQAQVEVARQQARAGALAKSGLEVDTAALDSAKLGLQLCLAVLGDRARAVQAQRSANVGDAGPRISMSALELSRLAQAVDLWHRIGLRAVGDPEVHRLEVTGAGGRPIEIAAELKRDDPQRLAGVLAVLTQAGLGDLFGGDDPRGAIEARPGDDGVYTTEPPGR